MIKERFIEQYGLPKFTIGSGGSGGAMQQRLIAQNYPGLLDAITPGISYADLVSILPDVVDCSLLNRYFDANPAAWPTAKRATVDGYPVNAAGTNTTCRSWNGFARIWQTPFNGFSPVVPVELRYNPITNPTGARGSFWDGIINAFGRDPATGFARSALRQRRSPVRAERAEPGRDHGRRVPRPESRASAASTSTATSSRAAASATRSRSRTRTAPGA